MSDEIRHVMGELVAAINDHDVDRIVACHASNYEGNGVTCASPLHGLVALRRTMVSYLRAIPDLHIVDDVLVEGNRAVLIWSGSGSHQGTLLHIPATGRRFQVVGISLFTIEQGKITRGLHVWDVAGLLRTLGLLPDL